MRGGKSHRAVKTNRQVESLVEAGGRNPVRQGNFISASMSGSRQPVSHLPDPHPAHEMVSSGTGRRHSFHGMAPSGSRSPHPVRQLPPSGTGNGHFLYGMPPSGSRNPHPVRRLPPSGSQNQPVVVGMPLFPTINSDSALFHPLSRRFGLPTRPSRQNPFRGAPWSGSRTSENKKQCSYR